MGDIFLKLLNMSITASWLILAVLCIRLLFRKIPKWITCLLWGVVAIRLIFPFSIESAFSLQPSAEPIRTSTMVEGEVVSYVPSLDSNLTIVEDTVNPLLAETFAYQETESVAPLQVFAGVAGSVWLCGMIVLLIFALASMIKLRLCVREAVRYRENIYICDAVKSPFILGIIKPGIYLSSALNEEEMEYIIAHEKAHLRRKDHLWKPFGYLLLCIYWFNPLCWIAYIMLCKDIELACDEKVIKDMSFGDKKEYSRVLLSCASQRRLVSVCPLAFGEVGVKERVKSVLNYKRPAFWITMLAVIVCIIVAICFLTNPEKEYQIRITIPAGSTEEIIYQEDFCYSDEEISPKGNTLTLENGEGLGDVEVVLLPVEYREENAYEPTYMTPGMPVKLDVEKDAWFKIGVNMQNPTTEDIDVYVSVRNVEVRIAESEPVEESSNENAEDVSEWITEEINVEKRDITHDGVADYIVTSMTYLPEVVDVNATLEEKIAQQVMYDIVTVKVYEGSNTSDTYSEERLLWSQEYSRVHVGNGQVSVVQRDEKDYLLTSSLWAGQGTAAWEFEVFSLNETGDKEVIEKQSVEFQLEEDEYADAESYAKFKDLLEEYIKDGILIVACDIDLEQQLIRTSESQYIPQNYYSNALVKFENVEDEREETTEDAEEIQKELVRVVGSIGLENAYPWNNTVNFKSDADALIKMASDETGRFEIYGIMSEKYGTYGLLLNDWIGGEQNWNLEYVPWMYTGVQSDQPILEPDGNGKYIFAYVYEYEDGVPIWRECILDCGYDTGHMELISQEELVEELPYNEVPVNTLENVTMAMETFNSCEGDIEIVNQTDSEISTGEWYSIQRYEDGEWHRLDELIDGIWKEVEYHIPSGETAVFPTNWKIWFGELPSGQYRIVKEVYLHLENRIDTYYLATEFKIN